jgi:hypothetical protein
LPNQLPEQTRVAWAFNKGAGLSSEAIANLTGDFQNQALARAFLLQAVQVRANPSDLLSLSLPKLKKVTDSISLSFGQALAWQDAAASFVENKPISAFSKEKIPSWSYNSSKLNGARKWKLPSVAAEAFPFSDLVWEKAIALAETNRPSRQALFEVAARAYAHDKGNAMLKKRYIALAKSLNLDFFAEEAERQ